MATEDDIDLAELDDALGLDMFDDEEAPENAAEPASAGKSPTEDEHEDDADAEKALVVAEAPDLNDADASRAERNKRKWEVMQLMTEDQRDRYEAVNRSSMNKKSMRKLIHNITGQAPAEKTTIVICGITKLFVGELIEAARALASERGVTSGLTPEHINAAFQMLDHKSKIPHVSRRPKRMHL